jgi:hypothetical protein
MGHGKAANLAGWLKSALAMSKTPLAKPAASANCETEPAFVKTVESALGHQGKVKGGVLAVNVPRAKKVQRCTMPSLRHPTVWLKR